MRWSTPRWELKVKIRRGAGLSLLIGVLAGLAVASVALAADAHKGTYKGDIGVTRVFLKVAEDGASSGRAFVECDAGNPDSKTDSFKVNIDKDGSFSGSLKFNGNPVISLRGTFVSAHKASGHVSMVVCDGSTGKVTLTR
jgi:hypothetical protein